MSERLEVGDVWYIDWTAHLLKKLPNTFDCVVCYRQFNRDPYADLIFVEYEHEESDFVGVICFDCGQQQVPAVAQLIVTLRELWKQKATVLERRRLLEMPLVGRPS